MGRSRRERTVVLSKVRKKPDQRAVKQKALEALRQHVDSYESIYVFRTENMRNTLLKELRDAWKDSQFFFGRRRVAQVALGRSVEEEYAEGLSKLTPSLVGKVSLLFTNRPHGEVVQFFDDYAEASFARSGFIATEEVKLQAGHLDMFVPSQEQGLRELGLPVSLASGKVMLNDPFTVCEKGDVLTPERAKIVERLGIKMAKFKVQLEGHYARNKGFKSLAKKDVEIETKA